MLKKNKNLFPIERIISRIFYIRGRKVMFDRDLAELYGVETKVLNQSVKRNRIRFPTDFMFQLSIEEMEIWKSQIVTSKGDVKGLRKRSYVFTEQGVAILSSVLNSKRAIQVNIAIMRTFVKLREILLTHKELREKIEKMEKKYDEKFRLIFEVIKKLIEEPDKPKAEIGFKANNN